MRRTRRRMYKKRRKTVRGGERDPITGKIIIPQLPQRRKSESNIPIVSEYGLSPSNWEYIKLHKPLINGNVANDNTKRTFNEYKTKIKTAYAQNKSKYNARNSNPLTTNNIELTEEKFARGIRQTIRQSNKFKINASTFTVDDIRKEIEQLSGSLATVFIDHKQIKGSISTNYHNELTTMITPISKNKKYNITVLLTGLNNTSITNEYNTISTMVDMIKQKISVSASKSDIQSDIDMLSNRLISFRKTISNKIDVTEIADQKLRKILFEILFQKIDSVSNLVTRIKAMI